jgi:hypothetical protein
LIYRSKLSNDTEFSKLIQRHGLIYRSKLSNDTESQLDLPE